MNDAISIRQFVLDWLDDNYHFGEAEKLVTDDEQPLLWVEILIVA